MDKQRRLTLKKGYIMSKEKEIVTKNMEQINYLYGEETANALKYAVEQSFKKGNYVTISIDELDKLSHKHMIIIKIKLFFKRLFK